MQYIAGVWIEELGLKRPRIVSLEEAQDIENSTSLRYGRTPENLSDIRTPCCLATPAGDEYLWIVK